MMSDIKETFNTEYTYVGKNTTYMLRFNLFTVFKSAVNMGLIFCQRKKKCFSKLAIVKEIYSRLVCHFVHTYPSSSKKPFTFECFFLLGKGV